MPDSNLKKELYKSYIKMIKNSVGTKMFSSFYVKNQENGKIYDVLNNGEYSCAFFVGSILTIFNLIDRPHATISTTLKEIKKNNFTEIDSKKRDLKPGDILVWGKRNFNNEFKDEHIGFYIGKDKAISTSCFKKMVVQHDLSLNNNRKIFKVLRPCFN